MTYNATPASAAASTVKVAVAGPLAMPIPDGCSDIYASGWASADVCISQGTDILPDPPPGWDALKAKGFHNRLRAEAELRASLHPHKQP